MATPQITATGLKGFLQWLKQDQPAIYAATAAQIQKAAPSGFSGFNGSILQTARLKAGKGSMVRRNLRGLGDCCNVASCSGLQVVAFDSCSIAAPSVCIETSCAANAGTTASNIINAVGNVITSVASSYLNSCQESSYSCLVSTQLTRAQNGLTPLTTSSSSVGVPVVAGSTTTSSSWLWLAAGVGLIAILASKQRA